MSCAAVLFIFRHDGESWNYSLRADFSQPTCLHGVLHFSFTCREQKKNNQSITNVIKVPSEARFKSLKMHYSFSAAHIEVCWKVPIMVPPSVVIPFYDAGKVPTRIISYVWSFCSMLIKKGIFHLIKFIQLFYYAENLLPCPLFLWFRAKNLRSSHAPHLMK